MSEVKHYPASAKATLPGSLSTKLVGCSFSPDYPHVLHTLAAVVEYGRAPKLILVHEPENKFDANAVAVRSATTGRHLGHLPAALAARIAPELDEGRVWSIEHYDVLIAPGHEAQPGLSLALRRTA